MKKTELMKIFLVILMSVMLILTATFVQAADEDEDDEYNDLTNIIGNNTSTGNNTSGNTNNTNVSNMNTSALTSNTNKANTTNNTNSYNNTSLPKTGVEDSIPTMLLLVVFAISAVYAYKKVRDYKNI